LRGLRLFVRPIEPSDDADVRSFVEKNGSPSTVHLPSDAFGLIGKLLGDIVAVVSMDLDGDEIRISEIVVARELRRKRIGKAMMREAEQLASKMNRRKLIVDDPQGAQDFLRRVGFELEGERWVRVVS
jgi:ribosomal protein S18 acetylase RimI-like enzyme